LDTVCYRKGFEDGLDVALRVLREAGNAALGARRPVAHHHQPAAGDQVDDVAGVAFAAEDLAGRQVLPDEARGERLARGGAQGAEEARRGEEGARLLGRRLGKDGHGVSAFGNRRRAAYQARPARAAGRVRVPGSMRGLWNLAQRAELRERPRRSRRAA